MLDFELIERDVVRISGSLTEDHVRCLNPAKSKLHDAMCIDTDVASYLKLLERYSFPGPSLIPAFTLRLWERPFTTVGCIERLPRVVYNTLYEYQREGVQFGLERDGRFFLFDGMGLGKTYQAICFAASIGKPALVVTNKDLKLQWVREINDLFPECSVTVVQDRTHVFMPVGDEFAIWVVHYEVLTEDSPAGRSVLEAGFSTVLVDESDKLRSIDSKLSKYYAVGRGALLKRAPYVCLMTGTPMHARPMEMFCQIKAVYPDFDMTYYEFLLRYCDGKFDTRYNVMEGRGSSHVVEFNLLLSMRMVRRLQEKVFPEMPPLIITNVMFDLNATARAKYMEGYAAYEKAKTNHRAAYERAGVKRSKFDQTRALSSRRKLESEKNKLKILLSELKAPQCAELVRDLHVLNNRKSLVFFQFLNTAAILKTATPKFVAIDGSHSNVQRQTSRDILNDPESDVRLGLLSMQAAGIGGNYAKGCNWIFFTDVPWDPALWLQCIKRAHRLGQTTEVIVFNLLANDTLDMDLVNMHHVKRETTNVMVDTGNFPKLVYVDESVVRRALHMNLPVSVMRRVRIRPEEDESREAYVRRAGVAGYDAEKDAMVYTLTEMTEAELAGIRAITDEAGRRRAMGERAVATIALE